MALHRGGVRRAEGPHGAGAGRSAAGAGGQPATADRRSENGRVVQNSCNIKIVFCSKVRLDADRVQMHRFSIKVSCSTRHDQQYISAVRGLREVHLQSLGLTVGIKMTLEPFPDAAKLLNIPL